MKTYKEISAIMEKNIDMLMRNQDVGFVKDITRALEIWNTAVIKSNKEDELYTFEEQEKSYIKMIGYADQLLKTIRELPSQYVEDEEIQVLHIYTKMKKRLSQVQIFNNETSPKRYKIESNTRMDINLIKDLRDEVIGLFKKKKVNYAEALKVMELTIRTVGSSAYIS